MNHGISGDEEANVVRLISNSPDGYISLSTLKVVYRSTYGIKLQSQGKLKDWLETSAKITTKQLTGKEDRGAFLRSLVDIDFRSFDVIDAVVEMNILQMIRERGQISLSNLREAYIRKYGAAFQCHGKLVEWLQSSSSIGVRKFGKNDRVAYEKTPRMTTHLPLQGPVVDSDLNSDSSTMVSAVEAEQNDNDPEIDCDDIVTKLMSYAGGCFRLA